MKRPERVTTPAPVAGSPTQPSLLVWADDGGLICGVDEAGRLPSVAAVGTKEVRLVASVSRGTTVVVELKELLN